MNNNHLIIAEENARLELYEELHKGLQSIVEGRTKTSDEVKKHMEKRRKAYMNENI